MCQLLDLSQHQSCTWSHLSESKVAPHTYNNESVAHNGQILNNVDKKDILLQVQSQENAQWKFQEDVGELLQSDCV